MDPIITVKNVTKAYRIWENPSARVKSPLLDAAAGVFPGESAPSRMLKGWAGRGRRDFHALRDISFSVHRGQATAIIGRNGSGKSTLLQLIAGTLRPTSGTVEVRGRVSALLELGSGFNPEFTGRENVYLNGAIYGLTRSEMETKFAEIEAFADIGSFIEQPVKTYSSGMMVRLAFAVAVTVQPDILIIDEALAVGDVFFTQKCFKRIREILHRGATLIFVSHDMAAVQNLCPRGLLLHSGSLAFDGASEDCVSRYFNLHQPRVGPTGQAPGTHVAVDDATRQALLKADILPRAKSRHGDRSLTIAAAAVIDGHGAPSWDFEMMHRATVRMLIRASRDIALPSVGIQIHDRMGNLVYAAGTSQLRFDFGALKSGAEVVLDFNLTLSLYPGTYTLSLDAAESDATDPNLGIFYDRIGGLGPLTIVHHAPGPMPFYGVAQVPMEIAYA